MLARALIVVLIALNLGVAAWWLSRPATPAEPPPASDQGGAELVLLPRDDAPGGARAAAPASVAAPDPAPAEPAAAITCLRLGPFADRGAAEVAQAGLGARLQGAAIREEPGQASGYRVILPPAADRAAAQAIAERIGAAGFKDFLILNQGQDANAIALGAYRARETAERRVAALREAGFPAELRAQGQAGRSRWWLEGASNDVAAVRTAFPAAQEQACATLSTGALR